MLTSEAIEQTQELIDRAQSILIILDEKVDFDQQVTGCSLYLALKQQNKRVELVAPSSLKNKTIIGTDQLKTDIGNRNLLISFDYDEHSVGKVSYHIDEQAKKFYLTIKPEAGHNSLDSETVKFEKTGSDADLIFLVGVKQLTDLKQLYFGYESLYEDVTTITINNHKQDFAYLSLDVSGYSCYSEGLYNLLENMNHEPDSAVATNLFSAINHATQNFTSLEASAYTFEVAAALIKAGARRSKPKKEEPKEAVTTVTKGGERRPIKRAKSVKVLKATKVETDQDQVEKDEVQHEKVEKEDKKQETQKAQKDKKSEEISASKTSAPVRPSGLRV